MRSLELLESLLLFELIGSWLAHLSLLVVEHHLLHHTSRLAVQIAELAVLRLYLFGVDLGVMSEDVLPPLHLVSLLEVNLYSLLVLEGPCAIFELDLLAELTGQDGFLSLESDAELLLLEDDGEIATARALGNGDEDVNVSKLLLPCVWEGGLLCGLAIAISLVLCVALLRGELVVLVFCGGHGVVGCGGEEGWRGT